MTLSIWRYAHLALAMLSSLFLLVLAVTGILLAIDVAVEKQQDYRVANYKELNLAQVVPALREVYPEIIELAVDYNGFVRLEALDEDGNTVSGYIDPNDGTFLGEVQPKSQFMQSVTTLHRSLFLHETGRIVVGIVSFLLFLITVSGVALIAKRQQGLRHFFAKVNRDFFSQYFHVVTGRWALIPILLISLTGTYLFLARTGLAKLTPVSESFEEVMTNDSVKAAADFVLFQETKLSEVESLQFPFMEDDPEEFYLLKLKDREVQVHQLNGEVLQETKYPYTVLAEKFSLDLHTGRTNVIWALVLALASANILFFIYSGFAITLKRTKTKVKNKFKPEQAEFVLLVGSENGSTLFFANQVHKQLLADGKKAYLTELNRYQLFPQAKHLLVFTSTYGLGDAPTNATKFTERLAQFPQKQALLFSVVGFGSKTYADFCAYAKAVDGLLAKQPWASRFLALHTVHDRSVEEFANWAHRWSEQSLVALATAPAVYQEKVVGLKKMRVVEKTAVSADNSTFKLVLKPLSKTGFRSGDLLAVYPANDHRERFYSVANNSGKVQLMVKLHPNGFGSGYLYSLEKDDVFSARVLPNSAFHFPKKASAVAMIANGTGVAPFLGMIMENSKGIPLRLYAGFRFHNSLTKQYEAFAAEQLAAGNLQGFDLAFSREAKPCYVMDLIRRDAAIFADLLMNNGVLMICGSLAMQQDVEAVLDQILAERQGASLSFYKANKQVLTDCY